MEGTAAALESGGIPWRRGQLASSGGAGVTATVAAVTAAAAAFTTTADPMAHGEARKEKG